jgi:two-component system nitrogen regulation response regulator GlnG
MPTLLVIDDEESLRYSFRYVFEEDDVCVLTAATAAEGLEAVREHGPDVIVLDLQLPDRSGLEVFQEIRAWDATRPVIFITAHGTTDTAIEAMKGGAFDYLVKPVDLARLSQIITRAFDAARLMRVPALLPAEESGDRIVGRSAVMQEMCKAIGRIAPQDVNVLILGESGTGKELVARALYHHSKRTDRPFLAINCAAIPESLLESELFGHERGAFTGADRRRIGKFEQCDGGTIFLDEIGDMPLAAQAKILRVLQEQRFERLGSNETLQTRARVLAATNHDLEGAVADGRFRKDLYYRLKGVTIRVPLLRDRAEDVAELAAYFLFRFNRELGTDFRAFAPEAVRLLEGYSWPGNVRELQGALREAMLHGSGHVLLPDFLSEEIRRREARPVEPPAATAAGGVHALIDSFMQDGGRNLLPRAVETVERALLERVLRDTQGNQTQASELLGISRNTLRQKLRSLGFAIDRVLTQEGEDRAPEGEKT